MLRERVVTAVALAALFLAVLFFAPSGVFYLFLMLVVVLAAWEWSNLCSISSVPGRASFLVSLMVCGALAWWAIYIAQWFSVFDLMAVTAFFWGIALLWVQGYPSSTVLWQPVALRILMGFAVLIPVIIAVYELLFHYSAVVVLLVVCIVAAADIGAYFFGRRFGRHKLAPRVSPGKSWEGVVGGLMVVSLAAVIFSLLNGSVSVMQAVSIAIPTALVSVLGDLLESMLKRYRGIKDSSQLLPGHGGVLDRVDGLLAAIPIFTLGLSYWR